MSAQLTPTDFHDSLLARARHLRFRGVGSPYDFLECIGIVPIKEFIYKGAMLIDVAECLNVSVTALKNWITDNKYEGEIEEASTLSAEGYIRNGEQLLKSAESPFQLNKAKAMIEHGRFMASKKDKKTYGNQIEVTGGPAAVHYTFLLPQVQLAELNAISERTGEIQRQAIETEFKEIPRVTLNPLDLGNAFIGERVNSGVKPVELVDE